MVKFITPYDSLYVRSMALFNGKPLNEVKLREDDMEGSFHLGFWKQQQIVAVASFFPVGLEGYEGKGYRLRQMGVLPHHQGEGLGRKVLEKGLVHLQTELETDYLWCNARKIAYNFYERLGMAFISEEFDVPNIGPHKKMIIHLSK